MVVYTWVFVTPKQTHQHKLCVIGSFFVCSPPAFPFVLFTCILENDTNSFFSRYRLVAMKQNGKIYLCTSAICPNPPPLCLSLPATGSAPSSHCISLGSSTHKHFDYCMQSDVTTMLLSSALGSQKSICYIPMCYIDNFCAG